MGILLTHPNACSCIAHARSLFDNQWSVCDVLNSASPPGVFNKKELVADFSWVVRFYCRTRETPTFQGVQIEKASPWTGGDL